MNALRGWILALGTVQAVAGFVIAQDLYPVPGLIKLIIASLNVAALFALANMRSWGESDPRPHG